MGCGPDKGPRNSLTALATRRKRLAVAQGDFGLRVATAPVDTGCFALMASSRHGSHLLSDVRDFNVRTLRMSKLDETPSHQVKSIFDTVVITVLLLPCQVLAVRHKNNNVGICLWLT